MPTIVNFSMAHSHDQASESLALSSVLLPNLPSSSGSLANISEPNGKDPLSDVLRMVKLTGALFFLVDATSPWGIEVPHARAFAPIILPRAQHVVSYHIVLHGSGYAGVPGIEPKKFVAGDIVVFPHADSYAMLSQPGQRPEFTEGQTLNFFRELAAGKLPFVIKEGGGGPEQAQFVCGFLGCNARPFNPLLGTLPKMLLLKRPAESRSDVLDRLIELTLVEAEIQRAGGECIRLGLSELIFVEVLRRYLASLKAGQTGWLAGLRDPAVGRALALLHERFVHPWTLEELARATGVSRSMLADRFMHLVGCPPMHYLVQWRMQVAARLLSDGGQKIAAVAHEVGYASEAAFSRTFKKISGVSPAAWRQQRLA
jgi:AraC-like DNA-binding protein